VSPTVARTRQIAEWEVTVGQVALTAQLLARLTTVYWQLSGGPLQLERFVQATGKSILLIIMVVLYRRYLWPSHLALAVWPIGFLYAWLGLHVGPPILAVGVVLGAAFFLGAHGVRTLRRARAVERAQVVNGR
jgi:hypothetical protein